MIGICQQFQIVIFSNCGRSMKAMRQQNDLLFSSLSVQVDTSVCNPPSESSTDKPVTIAQSTKQDDRNLHQTAFFEVENYLRILFVNGPILFYDIPSKYLTTFWQQLPFTGSLLDFVDTQPCLRREGSYVTYEQMSAEKLKTAPQRNAVDHKSWSLQRRLKLLLPNDTKLPLGNLQKVYRLAYNEEMPSHTILPSLVAFVQKQSYLELVADTWVRYRWPAEKTSESALVAADPSVSLKQSVITAPTENIVDLPVNTLESRHDSSSVPASESTTSEGNVDG